MNATAAERRREQEAWHQVETRDKLGLKAAELLAAVEAAIDDQNYGDARRLAREAREYLPLDSAHKGTVWPSWAL
jgi:hypothetical protein